MPETAKQEELSVAAMHAVCAAAGFAFQTTGRVADGWGWDAEAHVQERLDPDPDAILSFRMRFQLKATKQELAVTRGGVSFRLENEQYNRLRTLDPADSPLYLALYQMPRDVKTWMEADDEVLTLRRCLRWVSLRGAPPSMNPSRVTVHVPEANTLHRSSLRRLAREVSLGRWGTYSNVDVS